MQPITFEDLRVWPALAPTDPTERIQHVLLLQTPHRFLLLVTGTQRGRFRLEEHPCHKVGVGIFPFQRDLPNHPCTCNGPNPVSYESFLYFLQQPWLHFPQGRLKESTRLSIVWHLSDRPALIMVLAKSSTSDFATNIGKPLHSYS